MTLEEMYREDCDTLKLLADEFERMNKRYSDENDEELNRFEAKDMNVYHPPKCIHNLKQFLTGSLLVQAQGLLDFYIPTIVEVRTRGKYPTVKADDVKWRGGNILEQLKRVLKSELKANCDFSRGPFPKLLDFYRVRNDLVHNGGYLSEKKERPNVNKLQGVWVSNYTDLYQVEFDYCRSVLSNAEALFLEVDGVLSR